MLPRSFNVDKITPQTDKQTYKLPFFKTLYVVFSLDDVSRTKFYQDHTKNKQTNKLKPATATDNDDVDEKTDSVVP